MAPTWHKIVCYLHSTQLSSPAGEKVVFEAVASSGAGVTATWLKDNAQLDDKLADRLKVGKDLKRKVKSYILSRPKQYFHLTY